MDSHRRKCSRYSHNSDSRLRWAYSSVRTLNIHSGIVVGADKVRSTYPDNFYAPSDRAMTWSAILPV